MKPCVFRPCLCPCSPCHLKKKFIPNALRRKLYFFPSTSVPCPPNPRGPVELSLGSQDILILPCPRCPTRVPWRPRTGPVACACARVARALVCARVARVEWTVPCARPTLDAAPGGRRVGRAAMFCAKMQGGCVAPAAHVTARQTDRHPSQ